MFIPERFHLINTSTCLVIGYVLNITLLWLISKRTPQEMLIYRPILYLSTITDLVYLAVYIVVQPVMIIDSGLCAIISLGPLGWLPQPWNFVLISHWMFFYQFSQYSLGVPFVYRYMVICKERQYGLRAFLSMLIVPVGLCFGQLAVLAYAGYTGPEEEKMGRAFFFSDATREYIVPYFTVVSLVGMAKVMSTYTGPRDHCLFPGSSPLPCWSRV